MRLIVEEKKQHTLLPKIMRVALRLFVQKGIDGTTIQEIAREAKVAEGALYRHFKSKNELAWHLFSHHLNQFTNELTEKVFSQPDAQARLRTFVAESFAAFEEDRELFNYLILSEHTEFRKYSGDYLHPGQVLRRVIEQGQHEGSVRSGNLTVLASIALGAVIRVCIVKTYGTIDKDLRELTGDVSEYLWTMLKA